MMELIIEGKKVNYSTGKHGTYDTANISISDIKLKNETAENGRKRFWRYEKKRPVSSPRIILGEK
jgi:hypothetical protein